MLTLLLLANFLFTAGKQLEEVSLLLPADTVPRIAVPVKSPAEPKIAFQASIPVDFVDLPAGILTVLPFNWLHYNYGNGYSKENKKFTAPVAGIYHFDMQLDGETNNAKGEFIMSLYKNGGYECEKYYNLSYVNYSRTTFGCSCDVELKKGDIIELKGKQTTAAVKRFYGNNVRSFFNGHLVMAL